MNHHIFFLLALLSCSGSGNRSHQVAYSVPAKSTAQPARSNGTISDPLLFRKLIDFPGKALDSSTNSAKRALIDHFTDDLGILKPDQIESVTLQSENQANEPGNFLIYKIKFSANAPYAVGDIQYVVVSEDRTKAALMPLSGLQPLQLGISTHPILLSGLFMLKGKGFYMIYRYDGKNGFRQIFDSSKDPDCGILPIYNGSLDCISYAPFQLSLNLTDINGDKIKDLVFSGKVLYFCQGLETGYSREDRKPLKQKSIRLTFQTIVDGDSLSWRLADTTACHLLMNQ